MMSDKFSETPENANQVLLNSEDAEAVGESSFATPSGYVVFGTRNNPASGQPEVFRTPERGSYPEDIADRMVEEMRFLHPKWHWGKMKA